MNLTHFYQILKKTKQIVNLIINYCKLPFVKHWKLNTDELSMPYAATLSQSKQYDDAEFTVLK